MSLFVSRKEVVDQGAAVGLQVAGNFAQGGAESADLERAVSGDGDMMLAALIREVSLRWLPVWRVI
jgi:hypothetical protein